MEINIDEKDIEVLKAVKILNKYRSDHACSPGMGFNDLAYFIDLILDAASKEHVCPNCKRKFELYK